MTSIPNQEVSASKITTAFGRAGCGMKFYYRYIEGIRGVMGAPLVAGIAYDEGTRQLHDNMIAGETIADPWEVFVHSVENPRETNRDGELVEYDLSEMPLDIVDRGVSALRMYEEQAVNMKPLATQVYVEASFDETDAKLIGYVDLVEAASDGLCVSDIKSSINPRKKWDAVGAARDAQLGIYSVLVANQMEAPVTVVGWRHARLGGKIDVAATHVKAPNAESVMSRVSSWIRELEHWCSTGDFPASGLDKDAWVCSEKYCDYYHRCPYGNKSQHVIPVTIGEGR